MDKNSIQELLAQGEPIDARDLIDGDILDRTDRLMNDFVTVLGSIDPAELKEFSKSANISNLDDTQAQPHLSTAQGWDPATRTGLRMPNPASTNIMSPVIAFQMAEAHLESTAVSDRRLDTLTEQACAIGERVLSAARLFAPLKDYALRFESYETRINANLASEKSILWPQNTPKGYLHAPHQDRSVATVGLRSTADGFRYFDFEKREFTHDLPENYTFLGKSNGLGAKACLHAVERTAPVNETEMKTAFGIGRVSVVVFLQGSSFVEQTTVKR